MSTRACLTALLALLCAGCPAPPLDTFGDIDSSPDAPVDPRWVRHDIEVCWETWREGDGRARQRVRDAVSDVFVPDSGRRFVGWQRCADASPGVRIEVRPGAPGVETLGQGLDGLPGGVGLDLDPGWDPTCGAAVDCLARHARHAFGHVLGLDDARRTDAGCAQDRHLQIGLTLDAPSIVSACGTENPSGELTPADRFALARLYQGAGERLGEALASCDFDGDGIEDLAVGRPGHIVATASGLAAGAGRVDLIMGVDGRRVALLPPEPAAEAAFGAVLTAGDFDGDAFCDLAVGTPRRDRGAGGVVVFNGAPIDEIGGWRSISARDMGNRPEAGDRVGARLAAGDLDGDGLAELIVGAPGEDLAEMPDVGAVMIMWGSPEGPALRDTPILDGDTLHDLGAHEAFGGALATGDLDGDGLDDLVVGSTGTEVDGSARLTLFGGDGAGGIARLSTLDLGPIDARGMSMHAAHVGGDAQSTLAVGLPFASPGGSKPVGQVVLVNVDGGVLVASRHLNWSNAEERGDTPALFGAAVMLVDGVVFVGAPGAATVVGLPLDGSIAAAAYDVAAGASGSELGAALSRTGRVDGRGSAIALGAPGDVRGDRRAASAVHVIEAEAGLRAELGPE